MNKDFPRIISVLRREKGLSQKIVAQHLNISQALLSHYEKGIRECGLDFVVRISNYYGVSCDYLLGKTSDRHGRVFTLDEPPELNDNGELDSSSGNTVMTVLNKKLILNSIYIITNILVKLNNKRLSRHISMYLMTAVYKSFRALVKVNVKNSPEDFFTLNETVYNGFSNGIMEFNFAKALADIEACREIENGVEISNASVQVDYPDQANSLTTMIQSTEKMIQETIENQS